MEQDELLKDLLATVEERRETLTGAAINVALLPDDEDNMSLYYLSIEYGKEDELLQEPQRYEYDSFIVARIPTDIETANQFIEDLLTTQTFKIQDLPMSKLSIGIHTVRRVSSRENYGRLKSNWPSRYYQGGIAGSRSASWYEPVSAKGLPLFPTMYAAIVGLLELRWYPDHQIIPSELDILVPDYRARITALKIRSSSVALQAESGKEDLSNTVAKFFVVSESGPSTSHEVSLVDGVADFEVGERPLEVYTELVSAEDGSTIDSRRFNYRGFVQEDVQYDDLAIELDDMIRGGENENVEFKLIYNSKAPHEVLESVVSFANSKGGIIIIGVDDNGNIKGVEKDNTQSIRSQIISHCDPPPHVEIGKQAIGETGKEIIYIRVPKGDNPPYTLFERGVFVRYGSSDMHPRRAELDKLTKKEMK